MGNRPFYVSQGMLENVRAKKCVMISFDKIELCDTPATHFYVFEKTPLCYCSEHSENKFKEYRNEELMDLNTKEYSSEEFDIFMYLYF